jgi:hypothetical protein
LFLDFVDQKVGNVSFSILLLHFAYLVSDFGRQLYFMFVFDVKVKCRKAQINFWTLAQINLSCLLKSLVFVLGLEILLFLSSEFKILALHWKCSYLFLIFFIIKQWKIYRFVLIQRKEYKSTFRNDFIFIFNYFACHDPKKECTLMERMTKFVSKRLTYW